LAIVSKSVNETHQAAEKILKGLKKGDVVFLNGDLGVGKTEMVKGFVKALGGSVDDVQSPTYLSALSYLIPNSFVVHVDFYKYKKSKSFMQSFIIEYLEQDPHLIFVEWGHEISSGFVVININEINGKRHISVLKNER
tara:strand:- start:106 stop:519 length:414 start_codon:yes stop_codon:yes gene_type:complete